MLAIFWRTLKDRRTLLIIYCLSSIALLWMYVALFPSIREQSASLEAMMKNYPQSFMKAFNFDIKAFTTLEGFISTEQFSFVWPILVTFMMVGYAGYAIAGEIESGTIEVLLAQPISRAKLFLGRYFAGLFILIVFTIFSIFAAIPIAKIYGISIKGENFVTMALLSFMFALSIYSIGMFASAVFSDKGKVFFITGVTLVAMYVLNILSSLKDSLADLKYASFFYYFNPGKALVYNEIVHEAYFVFIGISILLTFVGFMIFLKRDITT